MSFEELLQEIKKLTLAELRFDLPHTLEAVVRGPVIQDAEKVLQTFFGPATKPTGKSPTKEMSDRMEEFGGIRSNQTAYTLEQDGFFHYAMLWPWSDKTFITLKIEKCQPKKK